MKTIEEIIKNIKYDSESCEIKLNETVIGEWNDEASIDYPEDLIWRRDISSFHHKAFKAGFDAGVAAERERAKVLVEALEYYSSNNKDDSLTQTIADKALEQYKSTESI